jgi:hypothetical protein
MQIQITQEQRVQIKQAAKNLIASVDFGLPAKAITMSAARISTIIAEAVKASSHGTSSDRPRVLSQTGTNIFRGTVGPDSKPVGSIELGNRFTPAPGATFSREDLRNISSRANEMKKQ